MSVAIPFKPIRWQDMSPTEMMSPDFEFKEEPKQPKEYVDSPSVKEKRQAYRQKASKTLCLGACDSKVPEEMAGETDAPAEPGQASASGGKGVDG